jgi:hypothetical protein
MVEVLIEDFGYEALAKPVVKPLTGIKFAGYVGCQTNRPFGIAGESFENPRYLDKLVETVGGEPLPDYDQKVTCCGGALAFSEPDKSQTQIKAIVESAYDHGTDMIVTPCPLCQTNVEVYQSEINRRYGRTPHEGSAQVRSGSADPRGRRGSRLPGELSGRIRRRAREYSTDKWLDILRKTAKKMSAHGRAAALGLISLPAALAPLVERALNAVAEEQSASASTAHA